MSMLAVMAGRPQQRQNETDNNIHIITDDLCLLWNNNQSDEGN